MSELNTDQQAFRDVVSRFMNDKSPVSVVRQLMQSTSGYDPALWRQLCQEVGLAGVHIPEAYGGSGFGQVELGIVAEAMGRNLFCGPFFASSVMAGTALVAAAKETHKQTFLPGIADGSTIATLVLDSLESPERVGRQIREVDGCLSGTAAMVVDAQVANLLIVVASSANGVGLYALPADAAGVAITPLEVLDPTRKLARVSFDQATAEHLGEMTSPALNQTWDHICVALCHEMIGGAQYLLESTVEYTKVRVQFGRPIGSFQALKHRCADLLMDVEFARAATHHAAQCLDSAEGQSYAASMAKALASDTYSEAARAAIQLRGGIGFTWENDTHLWFKRAKSSEVFMGSAPMHRERMMQIIERAEGSATA